ncbi:MAG TPA: SCO family protein [Polyangia bacterium]
MGAFRLPRLLLAAGISAAVGGGAGVGLHLAHGADAARPALAFPELHGQAVWPAGRRPAPVFALHDQNGRLVSLAGQRGRTVVVAFMDPRCRNECAIEGRALALAERQVAPSQRPVLLIVSLGPGAEAAEAKRTARRWRFPAGWHWLLGRGAQLARVWRAYDIAVGAKANVIAHSGAVYVIDRSGFERAGVTAPFLPQFVADDFRVLARGAA